MKEKNEVYRVWHWREGELHMDYCGKDAGWAVRLWIGYVQALYISPARNSWIEYIAGEKNAGTTR